MHFNFNIKCLGKKLLSFALALSLALPISIMTQKPITAYAVDANAIVNAIVNSLSTNGVNGKLFSIDLGK